MAQIVQRESERRGGVIDGAGIERLFREHFVHDQGPYRLLGYRLSRNGHDRIEVRIGGPAGEYRLTGEGQGAIAAFVDAWTGDGWGPGTTAAGPAITVLDYQEHAIGEGTDAEAAAYCLLNLDGTRVAGAAIDQDVVGASLKAVLSALNRAASMVEVQAMAA